MTCDVLQSKLDAYVDDDSSPRERELVEEHLRTCHACATAALDRIQMKRAVRAAGERYTPSPESRMRVAKSIHLKQEPHWTFRLPPTLIGFAAALLLVVLSSALWMRHATRERALAELVDLHVATLASANPVDVISTDRHTVKPWFQGKLPFTFNLPELENSQYKLVGGRLVYVGHRPAAQLVYELRKHDVSVFVVQGSDGGAGPNMAHENGFSIESWTRDGLQYIVVSDAGPVDVHALGELFRGAVG